MSLQPLVQEINRRAYDNLSWLRPIIKQPALLLLLPAAVAANQWDISALIAVCCVSMSWLVHTTASANAKYHLVRWLVERIEADPQIRVYEPTDYFPGLQAENIWPSGDPVSVSVIVIPTLDAPAAVPVAKDRTVVAFHSRPDQMINLYRYYPLLHEFGHVGRLHALAIAFPARNSFRYISTAALVISFATSEHCWLLLLLVAFACWASMFAYDDETLQAEVAADHFALTTLLRLTNAGVFAAQDHQRNSGPLYDGAPLQGLETKLPERLQLIRRDIFNEMRADIRNNGTCDLDHHTDSAIRQHGMHVEGLLVAGFASALVVCSLFLVKNVSWPGPLSLITPALMILFCALVSQGYASLGERLLKLLQESDLDGAERSIRAVEEWTARSRPRTFAAWMWMDRLSQRLNRS